MFGLPIVAKLLHSSLPDAQAAAQLVRNIVTYIVKNNFYLIDVTGLPTTWGVWNPAQINLERFWSDERLVMCSLPVATHTLQRREFTPNSGVHCVGAEQHGGSRGLL